MVSPTQLQNVLCRYVTIEARFILPPVEAVARIGIGPISTGPVTADSRGALWKALYVQGAMDGQANIHV
jgi:hypothetical protein